MPKNDFTIERVDKETAGKILLKYHYLKDISKGFKSGFNYGLFKKGKCVGVCIFTAFPVPELARGMLGLQRDDQDGLFELSRLCLTPTIQKKEHNLASWFVSRSIKLLRKEAPVRVILSYADADYHSGVVYQACNFIYYGLSALKKDFWFLQQDGTYKKHTRGRVKGLQGEWRKRSQKHRYVLCFDKTLKVKWERH